MLAARHDDDDDRFVYHYTRIFLILLPHPVYIYIYIYNAIRRKLKPGLQNYFGEEYHYTLRLIK